MENDTPRSQIRREVREKRLAYYETGSQCSNRKSASTRRSGMSNGVASRSPAVTKQARQQRSHNNSLSSDQHEKIVGCSMDGQECEKSDAELPLKNLHIDFSDEVDQPPCCSNPDTSRTSDILMETARDFREILKERESRHSKPSQGSGGAMPTNSSALQSAPSSDLSTRSVKEVLKELEKRATARRRMDFPRLSDLSDSEDDNLRSSPTDQKALTNNSGKRKQSNEEWIERMQQLTGMKHDDLLTGNRGNKLGDDNENSEKRHSNIGDECMNPGKELSDVLDAEKTKKLSMGDPYGFHGNAGLDDQQMMQQEIEFQKQHESILQKILSQSHYPNDFLAANASLSSSVVTDSCNFASQFADGGANHLPNFAPKPAPVRVAYSADEILSKAGVHTVKYANDMNGDAHVPDEAGSAQLTKAPQSPNRRSVHFNCPPTPAAGCSQKKEDFDAGFSSSIDATSSSSVVSLMSIKDVADKLEELGINPHLLGVELTSGTKYSDDKPRWKNKNRRLTKICPECGKCNADTVSWCLNCSCVLIGIDPQPLPKRRHRGGKARASSSISTSYDSSKDSSKSSTEFDHSNASSIMEQQAVYLDAEGNQVTRENADARSVPVLPLPLNDDDISIVSSMVSDQQDAAATPTGVWDPKQLDVAQLLQQSRALLDGGAKGNEVPPHPPQCATPKQSYSRGAASKNGSVLLSTDSTLSSVSLATPSPNRPSVPSHILEDLKLDLISSSVEDSPAQRTKNDCVADIAVLDRQDRLALRESSAASIKPDSVPQLPLPPSPSSTADGERTNGASSDDLKVDEVLWQDPAYAASPCRNVHIASQSSHSPPKAPPNLPKGRRDRNRRACNSAGVPSEGRPGSRREDNDRRRPLSSQQTQYQRRWKNSSFAWSNHHPSQLKKKPAEYIVKQSMNASDGRRAMRPGEISFMQSSGAIRMQTNTNSIEDPVTDKEFCAKSVKFPESDNEDMTPTALSVDDAVLREESKMDCFDEGDANQSAQLVTKEEEEDSEPMGLNGNTIEYLQQPQPRGWKSTGDSPWLYLADEVWLRIFSFLSPKDLSSCAASCQRLHRIANDSSLWRWPVVKRRHEITEDELFTIGARRPISLKLRQCRGKDITLQGLRTFFNQCGTSLRKLCFSGCNHGAFSEDQFILLAALFCPQLTSVDISFAYGVRDSTVRALAEGCERLECVRLNGAQHVTDSGVKFLAKMHGESLRKLELYCCFGVTSDTVRELSKQCVQLTHVSFGSCNRVSSNALVHFASHRREHLKHLDLRGLHCVLDSTIIAIVAVCPNLESLTLSNCGSVSNVSIRAVANHCPRLRKLDVCGCNQVGSDSAQELVRKCKHLEELDFSSSCVDHKTVTCLAHTWTPKLKSLRLNFCCNLKEDGIFKLCSNSKSLCILYLFGIRNFCPSFYKRLRKEYPRIEIKADDSREGVDG